MTVAAQATRDDGRCQARETLEGRVDLSLLISTRNRATQLRRCLDRVAEIKTSARWELVVIDNGSTDNTAEVVSDFAKSAPFAVQQVYEPKPGLARGHNAGVAVARGRIIALTDDDCYPASDYVDQALAVFEDPKIGFAGGRITLYDPEDYPFTINELTIPRDFPPRLYMPAGDLQGANLLFRRQVLDDIGGFDDNLGSGGLFNCEDVDACARASFEGWWGRYAPGPTVAHHHGRKAKDIQALKRAYAIGRGAYIAKFMLNRDSSMVYFRVWIGRMIRFVPLGPRNCLQELTGLSSYLLFRLGVPIKPLAKKG